MAGSAAFDVILTAILAIFTGGIGVAASLGSKARLLGPLKRLGEKFIGLAKLLKKIKKPRIKSKKTKVGGGKKNNGTPNSQNESKNSNRTDEDSNKSGDDPESPTKTPAPTKKEIELAKSEGNSPEQRFARDKVARHHMENNGYTDDQIAEALGSSDGSRVGGCDLAKPVEVVTYPPPDKMSQYVRPHGYPGNWFDPKGGQSPDQLGISGEGRTLATFDMPKGSGLQTSSASIVDKWTNPDGPVHTNGGGTQIFVNDDVKNSVISLNNVGK